MTGWGTGPWGLGEWGTTSGAPSTLFITNAMALTPHSVRVTLSRDPAHASTIADGDALNPATWFVLDSDGNPLTVIAVVEHSDEEYDVVTLQAFDGAPNVMTVGSNMLQTAMGLLIGDPDEYDFIGMEESDKRRPTRTVLEDLENPQADIETHPGGTLLVDSSNDYRNHSGIPFLKKLVMRRFSSLPGAYFHLAGYGLGIRTKEPLGLQDLVKLRTQMERQLLEEPEFASVRVPLSLSTDGILRGSVHAILSPSNTEVQIPFEIPTILVSL